MITIALSLLVALAPPVQVRSETGRFTIRQDGRPIGTEEFTITAIRGGYLAEGQLKLNGEPTPMKSKLQLDEKLNPLSYEYEDSRIKVRLKIENPVSELEHVVNGRTIPDSVRFPAGGFILENMFHHYVLFLYKAAVTNNTLIPVLSPQTRGLGSATVRGKRDQTFDLEVMGARMEATVDAEGRLIRLTIPEGKLVVER